MRKLIQKSTYEKINSCFCMPDKKSSIASTIKMQTLSTKWSNANIEECVVDSGSMGNSTGGEAAVFLENEKLVEESEETLIKKYASLSREQLISRLVCLEKKSRATGLLSLSQQQNNCCNVRNDSKSSLNNEESIELVDTKEPKKKKKSRAERPFDPSKYNTQLVAFKLAYLGKCYNGFEHHFNNLTPLPTIEEELWKAFMKAKLIFPREDQPVGDWEGCDYSKCGRTDKGVSAFGQVISLKVRTNRPLKRNQGEGGGQNTDEVGLAPIKEQDSCQKCSHTSQKPEEPLKEYSNSMKVTAGHLRLPQIQVETNSMNEEYADLEHNPNFDPIADELPYVAILNRLLPSDIRILAWCPVPIGFSSRFACRERQYRYFFTQPCFSPIPNPMDPFYTSSSTIKEGYLDIEAMRTAAKSYEGLNDFRNFCKVDASKQINNFMRYIYLADIEEVADTTSSLEFLNSPNFQLPTKVPGVFPKLYSLTLHGSAFLWHQVRHMVAILFLVGQGLENPSIVTDLLDVDRNPRRPTYQMAAETPLVLWDCIFTLENDSEGQKPLKWIYAGDIQGTADTKYGVPTGGLMDNLWRTWRERKIDEVLASSLMGLVARQGKSINNLKARSNGKGRSQKIFDGSDTPKLHGTYTPVMKKPLMDTVNEINQRYAQRKGLGNLSHIKV